MGKFSGVIAHLRQWIAWDREFVEDRKSGMTKDFDIREGRRVNTTKKSIKDAEAKIAKHEGLVRAYEKLEK